MNWLQDLLSNLSDVNWQVGTITTALSSAGTLLAFTLGYRIFHRDAEVRRLAQTRKVAFYRVRASVPVQNDDGSTSFRYDWKYIVDNLSDEPIHDVEVSAVVDGRRTRQIFTNAIILPDDSAISAIASAKMADLVYRDNASLVWQRSIDGRVKPLGKIPKYKDDEKDPRMKAMEHEYKDEYSSHRSKVENDRRKKNEAVVRDSAEKTKGT